jgi:hypothetical protein
LPVQRIRRFRVGAYLWGTSVAVAGPGGGASCERPRA